MAFKSKVNFWGLVCEGPVKNVSIGRVSFWIVLTIMCYMWLREITVPDSLVWSWTSLVLYNVAKKPLGTIDEYMKGKKVQPTLWD